MSVDRRLGPVLTLTVLCSLSACGDSGTDPEEPSIALSESSVSLSGEVWGEAQTATVEITNDGTGTLDGLTVTVSYDADEPTDWLTTTLDGTTAPATLALEARPLAFAQQYGASVTVTSSSATNSPRTVEVALSLEARPVLYLIRQSDDVLRWMDPETLEITDIGPLGVEYGFGGCAWDPVGETLYLAGGRPNNVLYRVDLATGAATAIGEHGIVDLFGLEYHPPSETIFGTGNPRTLYTLDPATGEATTVGATGGPDLDAIVWDSSRETMFAQQASIFSAVLFTLDLETAAATFDMMTPPINNHSMVYVPETDRIWAVDTDGEIYRYDPSDWTREMLAENQGLHACIEYVR